MTSQTQPEVPKPKLDALYDPARCATIYRDPRTGDIGFVLTNRASSLYDADGLSEIEAAIKAGSLKAPGLKEMRNPYEACDSLLAALYPPARRSRRQAANPREGAE